jgi:RNA polymerase sigma factor (sigma-70 family)
VHDGAELQNHWHAMVRVCRRVLDSREEAEDCASTALLQALERPETVPVNAEAFLITVAKRRASDRLRSVHRERARLERMSAQPSHEVADVAEAFVEQAEARWLDQQAQARLPARTYAVLRRLADGETVDEAAAALEMSKRAAESHLLRARRLLRAASSAALSVLAWSVYVFRRSWQAAPAVPAAALVAIALPILTANNPPVVLEERTAPSRTAWTADATPTARHSPGAGPPRTAPTPAATLLLPSEPMVVEPSTAPPPEPSAVAVLDGPAGARTEVWREERPQGDGTVLGDTAACLSQLKVTVDEVGC